MCWLLTRLGSSLRSSLAARTTDGFKVQSQLDDGALERIVRCVGLAVTGVARILYVVDGECSVGCGALELEFRGGSVLNLDVAHDGERLRVRSKRWVDPFAPPLSAENAEYVAASGKWTRVDVSAWDTYRTVLGETLMDVYPVLAQSTTLAGVVLTFGAAAVRVEVEGDEVYVDVVSTSG